MRTIRYSREHSHVYCYNKKGKVWDFVLCRLGGNWNRCQWHRGNLPRGTKFDGRTQISEFESAYFRQVQAYAED